MLMKKFLLILFVILMITFCGCSDETEQIKLVDSVNQIEGMEDYAPANDLAKAFSESVYYEVSNIEWQGEKGVAQVTISTPDLSKVISDSIQQVLSNNKTQEYSELLETAKENIETNLISQDYPTIEKTIEMDVKKTDSGFTLISNDDFERIISGNVEEIFINLLMEGLTNEK